MRLLAVNSTTTPAVTGRIAAEARAAAASGTAVAAVTAPFGLPLIVTASDWQVAGTATLAALGAARGGDDAAVALAGALVPLAPRVPERGTRGAAGLDPGLAALNR